MFLKRTLILMLHLLTMSMAIYSRWATMHYADTALPWFKLINVPLFS